MIKSSVTPIMLSYTDDVEQRTGLAAGRLFLEGGDGYMSIKKIAEKAGVSPATVSRVLNNRGYISDKTREKVYQVMKELNFSCDPHATWEVLTKAKHVSVVTGNNCLKVLFTRNEYKEHFFETENPAFVYIREKTDYWFGYNEEDYGIPGFYNWDVTAAVYLVHPEFFVAHREGFVLTEKALEMGFLQQAEKGRENCWLNLPEIGGEQEFKNHIYNTWRKVRMK